MKSIILAGLIVSVVLAVFISQFASSSPDGLERVAEDRGFLEMSEGKNLLKSPLPDYTVPFIGNERVSGSAAGFIGVVLTFGIMCLAGYFLKQRENSR